MADDRDQQRRAPDNPFDAWLAEAPAGPAHPVCPWCSARLDPPDADACPACGAQLRSAATDEIPGVTVVDPEAVRRTVTVRQSGGAGLFTWLTGDRDLVDAALAQQPPVRGAAPAADTGPANRDAVAPPDALLRREMRQVGREPDGLDVVEAADVADTPVAPDGPDELAQDVADASAPSGVADAPGAPGGSGDHPAT
jgi:hypothetical protein